MRTWPIILAVALVVNVAFAAHYLWEHDGAAIFSFIGAGFCLIGLLNAIDPKGDAHD